MDTIFALATAPGRAGVSVVRVSGPHVKSVVERLLPKQPEPRTAELCKISRADGSVLDHALVLYFEAPASFTGEHVLELHLHGSEAVVKAVLDELGTIPNCRMAEPGEFTRSALLNGKMDLTQVEGLADLIDAETELQRQQALNVASGSFGAFVSDIRDRLIRAAALLEAVIDFADEDVPEDVSIEVLDLLDGLIVKLAEQVDGQKIAERVRSGFEVAIVGPPNAGKSTLLNALAGREAAIVSEHAGTTRDVLEVRMDLGGIPVTFLDTAGIRETLDPVELQGIERAKSRAETADLRVILTDGQLSLDLDQGPDDIVLLAKVDLQKTEGPGISGVTGEGVDELVDEISDKFRWRAASAGLATRDRHVSAFNFAIECLSRAKTYVEGGEDFYDVGAEEIRSTIRRLDTVLGRVDVENLLDVIFSSFCLGK